MSDPVKLLEPLADPSAANETIAAAVKGFNDQAKAAAAESESSVECYVWDAFGKLFDVVGRTPPEHQGKLLDFSAELQQTTVTDADGKPLKISGFGKLWEDMPQFGMIVRDLWNFDVDDASATAEERAKWANWVAFLAQLTARSEERDVEAFDFSLIALWDLRCAFEEGRSQVSETAVKLAALWLLFAGKRLRKLSADDHKFDAKLGVARGDYSEREWKGFNEQRWEAWKHELKAAQDKLGPDETFQAAVALIEKL
ncbi:hypothetical protein C8A00DRAFT_34907 [Chaetomidium leptoderma]|uniref:Uncharacterized protein n=1 Tax=Chaetomidium leptoderma TaxID=669021 RepID=A0AAN6VJC9_9PEZI|nr:hypothetical protein C8A00DRAFT_34907 [Chaetomidium leptoderma]